MKRIILIFLAIVPLVVIAQNNNYVVKGIFENTKKTGKVFMTYNAKGNTQKDSAIVNQGKFEIKGTVPGAFRAYIEFVPKNTDPKAKRISKDVKSFYLEPATILFKMQDSLRNATVSGSQSSDDEVTLRAIITPVNARIFRERTRYSKIGTSSINPDSIKKSVEVELTALGQERTSLIRKFIKDHPDSYLSLWAIREVAGAYLDGDEAPDLFAGLSTRIKNTADGKEFETTLNGVDRTRVGRNAPEFVQPDTTGKLIKLSDFKGKYVLVDFWASWCHPCREENPRVLKAYNKFKAKDFIVVGISIDQEKMRSKWLQAIKDDGMPWTQLIDPSGDAKGAAAIYGVKAIPSNFLIGPDGKIIARNLRGENLEKQLERILN